MQIQWAQGVFHMLSWWGNWTLTVGSFTVLPCWRSLRRPTPHCPRAKVLIITPLFSILVTLDTTSSFFCFLLAFTRLTSGRLSNCGQFRPGCWHSLLTSQRTTLSIALAWISPACFREWGHNTFLIENAWHQMTWITCLVDFEGRLHGNWYPAGGSL